MKKADLICMGFLAAGLVVCTILYLVLKDSYEFARPLYFLGLLGLPVMAGIYFFQYRKRLGTVKNGAFPSLQKLPESWLGYARHLLILLRMAGLTLLLFVLARPQSKEEFEDVTTEGIDIIMAMDISTSMLAKDFKPNRLESAKKVAQEFVDGRPNDRMGIVVYEGESFTQVPLTSDHRVVRNALESLEAGIIEGGTAIGMGLATAVNRLQSSEAKSKVVILLTDGENNAGQIKPLDAARIADAFDVRIYAIGVGSKGKAPYPQFNPYLNREEIIYIDSRIDEQTLTEVAEMTGGGYFRATGEGKLREIYSEIDRLEKTKFNVSKYSNRKEEYLAFALWGLAIFCLEFLLRTFLFRFVA